MRSIYKYLKGQISQDQLKLRLRVWSFLKIALAFLPLYLLILWYLEFIAEFQVRINYLSLSFYLTLGYFSLILVFGLINLLFNVPRTWKHLINPAKNFLDNKITEIQLRSEVKSEIIKGALITFVVTGIVVTLFFYIVIAVINHFTAINISSFLDFFDLLDEQQEVKNSSEVLFFLPLLMTIFYAISHWTQRFFQLNKIIKIKEGLSQKPKDEELIVEQG
jgi:hypothetical protein